MLGAGSQAINDLESDFWLGGDTALEDAFEMYGSLIYTFCRRFLDEEPATSITRDVFVSAWQDHTQCDPSTASLGGWLMKRARFRVLVRLEHEPGIHRMIENAPAESEVSQVADRMLVADALKSLTESSRMVVELALIGGLTRAEVVERSSLPRSVVDREISESTLRLRRALMVSGG